MACLKVRFLSLLFEHVICVFPMLKNSGADESIANVRTFLFIKGFTTDLPWSTFAFSILPPFLFDPCVPRSFHLHTGRRLMETFQKAASSTSALNLQHQSASVTLFILVLRDLLHYTHIKYNTHLGWNPALPTMTRRFRSHCRAQDHLCQYLRFLSYSRSLLSFP